VRRVWWRFLIITFVGGLGSIVAAACVIGVAIVVVRFQEGLGLGDGSVHGASATVAGPTPPLTSLRRATSIG
jgi:hypothetical protein